MKLSIKITLLVVCLSLVFGLSFVLVTSNLLRDRLYDSQNEWVETLIQAISEGVTLGTINGDVITTREELKTIIEADKALDYAYVIDFDGRIFTHTFEGGVPRALIHLTHDVVTNHHLMRPLITSDGEILDIAHPLIKGMDAHIHLGINQKVVDALIQDTNKHIIMVVMIIALVGASIAIMFGQRITAPLYRLANIVRAYGEGKLNDSFNIGKSSQEIDELATTFEKMIENRQRLESSLNERNVIYRQLVESTTAIPWELDLGTWRFTYMGKQIVKLLGYPVEDWYTENFWADHLHPDDRDSATAYCQKEISVGRDHEFEFRMVGSDKRIVWIRDDVTIIYDENKPVRLQGFMFDITCRKIAELEQLQHMELMQQKQYAFLEWAKSSHMDLQQALHKASELSSETLQTDRVSIWLYNPERTAIICEDLYTMQDKKHDKGMRLETRDYPNYFNALEENRTLAISDARHAAETDEFTDSYLLPLDIYSMLDVPIRNEGRVIGVVCHEQTKHQCSWTLEQQDFAASIANTVALAIETAERKRAEKELKDYHDHLEELVELRTAELAGLNQELESFSYTVSHDLRAPLRAIDGFSQVLLEDYVDTVDEQGKDYLQRIRNSTQRMGELIDDLLKLSQLGRTTLNYEAVDLSTIAESILSNLGTTHVGNLVQYHVSDTEQAMCDPGLIRVVLENLLGNAWKYTSKTDSPVIEFGMNTDNHEVVYYVKDNGAGFDMNHAGNLFDAFQRIHGREYEGTGIGLATVKRVINRHGGRVWAEASVNHGATFYFTLGKQVALSPVSYPGLVSESYR